MPMQSDSNNQKTTLEGIRKLQARPNGALVRELLNRVTNPEPEPDKPRVWFAVIVTTMIALACAVGLYFLLGDKPVSDPVVRDVATSTKPAATSTPVLIQKPIGEPHEPRLVPTSTGSIDPEPTPIVMPKPVPTPQPEPQPEPAPEPTPQPQPAPTPYETISVEECDALRNSFLLYPEPKAQAISVERDLRDRDPTAAKLLRQIACIPQVTWLVGGELGQVWRKVRDMVEVADSQSKIPIFVLYNVPGVYEPTFASTIESGDYYDWLGTIANAIGSRRAWIILEPDSLTLSRNYSDDDQNEKLNILNVAVGILKEQAPNARIYIDAGHSRWASVDEAADLLRRAGIDQADGFSLNVSNYYFTQEQIAYGNELGAKLGGKHFVIDTSRNGVGQPADLEWCNAPGRALGQRPTFNTGEPLLDALLWIKPPGESDNSCNGGPPAGQFWLPYALDLVKNRK